LRDAQNHVTLLATQRPAAAVSSVPLPVEIHYRVEAVVDPLRWFVQLLGPDGRLIAQVDTAPLDGYSAFTDLPAGAEAFERVALILPAGLAAGDYQLIAGIYNPSVEGGPRLRSETESDFVDLGRVAVTAE
jgi:hypothetical protein